MVMYHSKSDSDEESFCSWNQLTLLLDWGYWIGSFIL